MRAGAAVANTGMTMGEPTTYTLQELAAAAGMTARNVRAYGTRSLLQPPDRHGRSARYGPHHLRRLRDVRALRDAGVSLAQIAEALRRGDELDRSGPLWHWAAGTAQSRREPLDEQLLARSSAASETDELVAHGILVRTGRKLYASAQVSASLTELVLCGVSPRTALVIALRSAQAALRLADEVLAEVSAELGEISENGTARRPLVRLASGVTGEALERRIGT